LPSGRASAVTSVIRQLTFPVVAAPLRMTACALAIRRLGPLAVTSPLDAVYPLVPTGTRSPTRSVGAAPTPIDVPPDGATGSRDANATRGIAPGAESPFGPCGPRGPRLRADALKSFAVSEPLRTLPLVTALGRSCFVPTLLRGSFSAA
jgi:hypothetical protein